MDHLKFCVFFVFYVRTVRFYLCMCVTWVVGFNGCGLPSLACFNEVTLPFFAPYLRCGGTWVHVVIERDLFGLA